MNDCGNAEIRDQLPDLLHERLDEAARAAVLAHLSTCIDCDEELRLLRDVLGLLEARAPRIDVAAIVSALPKPPAVPAPRPRIGDSTVIPIASRQRRWADWRVAAAVTLLVAGGSSAVVLNRNAQHVQPGGVAAVASAPAAAGASAVAASPTEQATAMARAGDGATSAGGAAVSPTLGTMAVADEPAEAADLGNGSRLGDLNEQQLQTLLNEIDKLPAVPVTDPEPVSLRVTTRLTPFDGT